MTARDGAVSITDQRGRVLLSAGKPVVPAREGHAHACGHGCFCYLVKDADCERCRRQKAREARRAEVAAEIAAAMARTYPEDSLTTEQLLERRS